MSSGFVSEADIAEKRRVRKEEWQSNKRDSDPDEPPEEPMPDHRTLFHRLKEQKDKKQEDWEEAHKLKNMVRGLEDDEVDFLEHVDNKKIQEERRIKAEENSALKEYRKKVNAMQQKAIETEVLAELKPEGRKSSGVTKKSSQLSLLAGAIKRKKSDSENEEESKSSKIRKTSGNSEEQKSGGESTCETESPPSKPSAMQCVAVLPGLGVYTDSSDSDNDSNSDSDLEATSTSNLPRDITGRIIHLQASAGGKGCC